jgi:hypothetical protein
MIPADFVSVRVPTRGWMDRLREFVYARADNETFHALECLQASARKHVDGGGELPEEFWPTLHGLMDQIPAHYRRSGPQMVWTRDGVLVRL